MFRHNYIPYICIINNTAKILRWKVIWFLEMGRNKASCTCESWLFMSSTCLNYSENMGCGLLEVSICVIVFDKSVTINWNCKNRNLSKSFQIKCKNGVIWFYQLISVFCTYSYKALFYLRRWQIQPFWERIWVKIIFSDFFSGPFLGWQTCKRRSAS